MEKDVPLAYNYIRFSTAEQKKGDSLRRQADLAKAYVDEKGLILDESLTMLDLGVSAYKGANAESGALSAFLDAIDTGRVPVGSYLLIESLDRLSRAQVFDALQLFIRIINKGITIVALKDKVEFSRESLQRDMTQLIICIVFMSRANEESETKSHRISQAWNKKREDARDTGKVLTRVTPFWLRAKADRSGHYIDPKAGALVRHIFELSRDGHGVHVIMKMLNAKGKTSPKGTFWTHTAVAKLLRNRAVIGEATFSSFKNPDGTRQPVAPIPDYYPAVIDKSLFYEVQDNVAARKRTHGGRQADSRNLFRGLLTCTYCNQKMQVISNTFSPSKRRLSVKLQCIGQRMNLTRCTSPKWDYYDFQYQFLKFVKELDVSAMVANDEQDTRERELKERIAENRAKTDELSKRLNRIITMIETSDSSPQALLQRIKEIESELVTRNVEGKMLADEWEAFDLGRKSVSASKESLVSLMEKLSDPVTPGPYDYWEYDEAQTYLRKVISQKILNLVDGITVEAGGIMLHGLKKPSSPSFSVKLKNGMTRMVVPETEFNMALDFRKKQRLAGK